MPSKLTFNAGGMRQNLHSFFHTKRILLGVSQMKSRSKPCNNHYDYIIIIAEV